MAEQHLPKFIQKTFWRLVGDASEETIVKLFDLKTCCQRIYVYRAETRSVEHPNIDQIPWPVCLLLTMNSPKHIFIRKNPPQIDEYGKALESLKSMIAKEALLLEDVSIKRKPWWYQKISKKSSVIKYPENAPLTASISGNLIQNKLHRRIRAKLKSFSGTRLPID